MADSGGIEAARTRRHRVGPEFLACTGIVVVAVSVEALLSWFVTAHGIFLGGDQPTYMAEALAFAHLSLHLNRLAPAGLAPYVRPVPIHGFAIETFVGAHGRVSAFDPGLGLLLTPFVAVGPVYSGAVVGMLAVNSAGLVLIHRRATRLTGLGRRGQILLAVMLASPALLLAMTQIYPDVISGILIACAILEIAILERHGELTRTGLVVATVSIAYLPWLQPKNFVPAVILLAALAFALRRARHPARLTATVGAVVLVSWLLFITFNLWFYGHALGLPEPPIHISGTGIEYILGLTFGRDQGLFVQVPFALLGVVGMWMARRTLPAAVLATVGGLVAVLVLNGTYTGNPYGGGSLQGRFMWTLVPAMVAWSAVVVVRWERAGRFLWTAGIVIGGLWLYLAVPILTGNHEYLNVFVEFRLWDPMQVTGWWAGLDRVLPMFDFPGQTFGSPAFGLVFELGVAALVIIAAVQYARPAPFTRISLGAMAALSLLLVVAVAVAEPALPSTVLTLDGGSVGAPVVGGAGPAMSPLIGLAIVLPGSYRLGLSYRLVGPGSGGEWVVLCVSTDGTVSPRLSTPLDAGTLVASLAITCPHPGTLDSQLTAPAHSRLDVRSLRLEKTSA
jgi:hypothetical protein